MKSQWEFGELFPTATTRKVWTVAELTLGIKRLLETSLGSVWVSGEVSNMRVQSSGHMYFTLKDASAQLSCVLFRGESVSQRSLLVDGQKVLLHGDLTVYEPRGQYQLVVRKFELQGQGALQMAFERLKQKLHAEGLFAPERKRPIPAFPQCVALVTSPTGAAIRDIIHVIRRRNPSLRLLLAPCRVQGEGAALEIAQAIQWCNQAAQTLPAGPYFAPELVLVTRGGGSIEDLWAFNEEVVARAIAASALPVVSAVGHEIDFTISDFVADLRAATPSAAAEIITEDAYHSRAIISQAPQRMIDLLHRRFQDDQDDFQALVRRLARTHPRRMLNEQWQRVDDLTESLRRASRLTWRDQYRSWESLTQRLARVRPMEWLSAQRKRVEQLDQHLRERQAHHLDRLKDRLAQAEHRLRLLSPQNILDRGFSITRDAVTGRVIRDAHETSPGQRLHTRLQKGDLTSVVE